MRVLVLGGNGVLGTSAVRALVHAGHEVLGTSRSHIADALLRRLDAVPVRLDVTDEPDVRSTLELLAPDVVVNMTTALRTQPSFRRLDATMAPTNRLRTQGTDLVLSAATDAGVKRYVGQGFAGWFSEPQAETEGDEPDRAPSPAALMKQPPPAARETVDALRHLERAVADWPGSGIVLRFGPLYGPMTSMGVGGAVLEAVRRRRVPVVGGGQGRWSFCHVDDAGRAIALAAESDQTGVFEIVDDDPAPVAEWLPELARAIDAPAPRRLPSWAARPMIGGFGVHLMTAAAPASRKAAEAQLGFTPQYPSWRDGFVRGLSRRR